MVAVTDTRRRVSERATVKEEKTAAAEELEDGIHAIEQTYTSIKKTIRLPPYVVYYIILREQSGAQSTLFFLVFFLMDAPDFIFAG